MYIYIFTGSLIIMCVIYYMSKMYFKTKLAKQAGVYNELISKITDTFFIIDNKLNILEHHNTDSNSAWFSHGDGCCMQDIFIGDNYATLSEDIHKSITTNEIQKREYIHDKTGVHYIVHFIRLDKNKIICIFQKADTNNDYNSVENLQNRTILDSLLDNMPFPVMLKDIDNDLKYIHWNKQCDILSGYNRNDVLGKTDLEIYSSTIGQKIRNVDLKVISSGESYLNQESFITTDGARHETIVTKNIITALSRNLLLVTRWEITDLVEVQDSLRLANSQLHLAFSSANITPWIWDIDQDKIYIEMKDFKCVNKGFRVDEESVSSDFVIKHTHPDDTQRMLDLLTQLRKGIIDKAEFPIRYDSDLQFNNFYNVISVVELFDENGIAKKIIGTIQNVTEQKTFEKELIIANEKIEQINCTNEIILDNTNIGLVYITEDYVVQWENVSKYSSHPLAKNYRKGVRCYENVKGLTAPCPGCMMQKSILSKKREVKEIEFSGNVLAQITASPVFDADNNCLGVVLKVKDITDDKKRESDLRQAKENAEKSDKLKSAFLANMSHEIRTPLNAIVGFSELLATTEDPDEKRDYLQVITSNNNLLLQLITDILDLSKIEANTLEFVFAEVDINGLMIDLERSFNFKIENQDLLKIVFEKPLEEQFIYTDRNRLQQVISNFITNAIKFTEQGSIRFGCERRGSNLYFYVTDTGTGIPKEKLGEIFKRFTKLDNFKTGTGLGLTICQTIIRKLDGDIGVNSELGKGSTFWFTIPWINPSEKLSSTYDSGDNKHSTPEKYEKLTDDMIACPKKQTATHTNNKPVLLIAEDVVDNYKLYKVFLNNKYQLIHAWNGEEAISLFKTHHPDAILMDIKMPVMDGYEAVAAIRRIDVNIPIIAVTAFAFAEDKKNIIESGFTDSITKPIHKQTLIDVLEKINL